MTLAQILAVAAGGAAGALARAGLQRLLSAALLGEFAYSLIIINGLGCFAVGLFTASVLPRLSQESIVPWIVVVGFLGSFTTFSGFALDASRLFFQQSLALSLLYIGVTIFVTLNSFALGIWSARLIW